MLFRSQECRFIMCIKGSDHRKVDIIGTEQSVQYIGGKIVGQFEITHTPRSETIRNLINCSSNNAFMFTIELERRPVDGVIQIIIPSLILWMCAFLTLRVNVEDFSNRNRTAVTELLVFVTFFGSITMKDYFPHTSGFKSIDD